MAKTLQTILHHARAFGADTRGATAIEYAIIACGIGVVLVAAINSLGSKTNSTFSNISTLLK